MKKVQWKTKNKMIFESEHKAFNNYIIAITTGNVVGGGQFSTFIRPFNETTCNGHVNETGYLQEFDLKSFVNLPRNIKEFVKSKTQKKSGILYKFYYCNGNYTITMGYVLTTGDNKLITYWNLTGTQKTKSALKECIKYITTKE